LPLELYEILAALQRDVPAIAMYLLQQLAQPVPVVAFDSRLIQAARAEGLTVISDQTTRQPKAEEATSA
jgi:hypothetical protein